ncbi:MAG TPA: type II CAAX endopeptidase family protein [Candidatus Saccharimonadales bacterium]|nr:type II CAAX endopeptidase family protein [Candidatus Saccharimonadales bacterium]
MDTYASAKPAPFLFSRIAAPLHTALTLAAIAVYSLSGRFRSVEMQSADSINRVALYERTLVFEWLLLAFVLVGVRLHGSPLHAVLGPRWPSALQVLKDIGIGAAFFVITTLLASTIGPHFGGGTPDQVLHLLLPRGPFEKVLWLAVSITAGICEEAIYRGYLQRQFTALTQNISAGIVLSAACFGAVHAYQGLRMTIQIALLGVLLGLLAQWCKSTRPGMASHAIQDSLAIFIRR